MGLKGPRIAASPASSILSKPVPIQGYRVTTRYSSAENRSIKWYEGPVLPTLLLLYEIETGFIP